MMKYSIPLLTLLILCSFSTFAFAQSTEVGIKVEYNSQKIKLTLKDNDAMSVLSRAIQISCSRICKDDLCKNECFQNAKLTIFSCINENNIKCRPNQEKILEELILNRKTLLLKINDNIDSLPQHNPDDLTNANINAVTPSHDLDSSNLDKEKIVNKHKNYKSILIKPYSYYSKPNSLLLDFTPKKQPSSVLLLSSWKGNINDKKQNKHKTILLTVENKKNKKLSHSARVNSKSLLK